MLYKFGSDGTQRFNSEELISNMFLWANDKKNGGRILSNGKIVYFDNNNNLNTKYQIYMNDSEPKNYLSSKGIECDMEYFSGDYTSSTNLRDDEFADTNLSDDSWAIQNEKQYNFLNKKLSALQENINQKNFPVRIFEYDDSLVIPFKNSN